MYIIWPHFNRRQGYTDIWGAEQLKHETNLWIDPPVLIWYYGQLN